MRFQHHRQHIYWGRNSEPEHQQISWSRDPELDRQIKQRVARNNMFMIAVVVVIVGCLLLK